MEGSGTVRDRLGQERRAILNSVVETSVSGPNGRHRVAVRVSAKGADVGFGGTALADGWVTVEVAQELPHALNEAALNEAASTASSVALQGVSQVLELLLASLTLPDTEVELIRAILADPPRAVRAGVPEELVRAFCASPERVWGAMTPDEKMLCQTAYPEVKCA